MLFYVWSGHLSPGQLTMTVLFLVWNEEFSRWTEPFFYFDVRQISSVAALASDSRC